ncbi:hypothetical protein V0M98_34730 (plasmid) [Pseudomonas silesiensis]|uniref:hypothetical protein n=1 Tax=Pseudomonas silesiensis TaxID=1853130 RepID=UPI0030CD6491
MGTFSLADGITGELITEGDQVVAMLLVDGSDEEPHRINYLFEDGSDKYKIASLPIQGMWDGSVVVAYDNNAIAVRSALYAANFEGQTFADLQAELYTKPNREIPSGFAGKGGFFQNDPPSMLRFSLFVAKRESIDLVLDNEIVKKSYGMSLVDELQKVDALVEKLLPALDKLASEEDDVRFEAYMETEGLSKAVFFGSNEHTYRGLPVPRVARALADSESSPFSGRLGFFLSSENLYRADALRQLKSTRQLPVVYQEVFSALQETMALQWGMKRLSIALNSATPRVKVHKDSARVALLQRMLMSELRVYVDQVSDDHDQSALDAIDAVLKPVLEDVKALVGERDKLETDIATWKAAYDARRNQESDGPGR